MNHIRNATIVDTIATSCAGNLLDHNYAVAYNAVSQHPYCWMLATHIGSMKDDHVMQEELGLASSLDNEIDSSIDKELDAAICEMQKIADAAVEIEELTKAVAGCTQSKQLITLARAMRKQIEHVANPVAKAALSQTRIAAIKKAVTVAVL